jgi:hypothetical protein
MTESRKRAQSKGRSASPHTKGNAPRHRGGDHARKAQRWGGGNKAGKGPLTRADRRNENSSAKS